MIGKLIGCCALLPLSLYAQKSGADSGTAGLLDVKRIYVAQLSGGPQADALRELIIASLDSTKLFVLTDNQERADAILKGAADDHSFTDSFDSDESLNSRENGGKSSGSSSYSARSGGYLGLSVGENESHHIKERKHEAYAAVRLCNRDGDVLWSTTQESQGAKFRGASADVAAKIARQLTLDVDRIRHGTTTSAPAGAGAANKP
ncbi:MAG: hypothetical protein JO340_01455 [Acidobacteriaceae bacterium]|nr:hypothetical protein [Acidobacteriaceae bacterium]